MYIYTVLDGRAPELLDILTAKTVLAMRPQRSRHSQNQAVFASSTYTMNGCGFGGKPLAKGRAVAGPSHTYIHTYFGNKTTAALHNFHDARRPKLNHCKEY